MHYFHVQADATISGERSTVCGICHHRLQTRTLLKYHQVQVFSSKQKISQRSQRGFIVGIGSTIKVYHVYCPKYQVVITTQHIKNIETQTTGRTSKSRNKYCKRRTPLQKVPSWVEVHLRSMGPRIKEKEVDLDERKTIYSFSTERNHLIEWARTKRRSWCR